MIHFSLLPCKCQAPAGWAMYPITEEDRRGDEKLNGVAFIIKCHVCGREVPGATELEAAEAWDAEFVLIIQQAQEEMKRQQAMGKFAVGPQPGGAPLRMVPPR